MYIFVTTPCFIYVDGCLVHIGVNRSLYVSRQKPLVLAMYWRLGVHVCVCTALQVVTICTACTFIIVRFVKMA